jgi:hypothetical protein
MEKLLELETRINQIDYRLRFLERLLDSNTMFNMYKGEQADIDAVRIEVLNDMRREIKDLKIEFSNKNGRDFYTKGA